MSLDLDILLNPVSLSSGQKPLSNNLVAPVENRPNTPVQQNALRRYDKRCAILRQKAGKDNTGGASLAWIQVGGGDCAIEPINKPTMNTDATSEALAQQSVETDFMFCPLELDIQAEDRIGVPGWFPTFKRGDFSIGQKVIPSRNGGNGHFYVVVKAGNTGEVQEPTIGPNDWPVNKGGVISVGGVTFREAGPCEFFQVVGTNRGESDALQLVCVLKRVT